MELGIPFDEPHLTDFTFGGRLVRVERLCRLKRLNARTVDVAVGDRDQTVVLDRALISLVALDERVGRFPFVDQQSAVEPAALIERRHQLEALNGADPQPLGPVG